MGSNTTLNPGNTLLITWVNMTYQIKDLYLPFIHFWDSGPWYVLYFLLLSFFCYFLWLLLGWCLFFVFVFMSLNNTLSNQELILTCLLSIWLIIKLYQYCYGSITLCYIILLNCIIVDYFILYVIIIYLVLLYHSLSNFISIYY